MKLIKILNPENASEDEVAKFAVRNAVRAIVYDRDGNIGILNVSRQNYHKLPGGGVEEGEDIYGALRRECKEELGCDIEINGEVGRIIEYRKTLQLKQISPCYVARVIGEKGEPSFTQEETEDGFEIQWVPIEKAVLILASDQPLNDEGRFYIVPRDVAFLEAARAAE